MTLPEEEPFSEEELENQSGSAGFVNSGYVLGQLAAALTAQEEHPDPAVRVSAGAKVKDWAKIFQGMFAGTLRIGSRQPVADAPLWATPRVVQGGFVTGDLLAEDALGADEQRLLERLLAAQPSISQNTPPRMVLNNYYLSEAGLAEMQSMVQTGYFRIALPEEGALPIVAWLARQGHLEAARALLSEIGPYFSRLRFYPAPSVRPLSETSHVHLQTVGQAVVNLQNLEIPQSFQAQREAALIWAPLGDRAVQLFLETVEGAAPALLAAGQDDVSERADGRLPVVGGWPCQHYPEDWRQRAQQLLSDFERQAKMHPCRKLERRGENLMLLRGYLKQCVTDPAQLTGGDVGMLRRVLADILHKRGQPDSERCRSLRQSQAALARRPAIADLAEVMISRLANLPAEEGLDDLDAVLTPISAEEAYEHRLKSKGMEISTDLAAGLPLTERLRAKVQRCLSAPVEDLVAANVITSAEVLATVIPQITGQVLAAGLDDPDLRRLYGALYRAFRRRRSLLLLNLESQVKFSELPWVQAADTFGRVEPLVPETVGTGKKAASTTVAWETLERTVVLAITSFPHQILPNKLLQELRALAKNAGRPLPLVEEVAADIFMGAFAEKFLRAAQVAGALLEGTLYERYYGISYAQVQQINDVRPASRQGTPVSPAFFKMCTAMAAASKKISQESKPVTGANSGSSWVAENGTVIEQEQILTTHNLAVLFTALDLTETLGPRLGELARRNFAWICRRQQQVAPGWQACLQMVKNTAYAWRQMIFFLALEPQVEVAAFLVWAEEYLETQSPSFQIRFRPALVGLARAIQGAAPEDLAQPDLGRQFLGWTKGPHWLLSQGAEAR